MNNPYEVLGLNENASVSEVKKAYKALAKKYQTESSDSGDSFYAQKKMEEINAAYDEIISGSYSSENGYKKNRTYDDYSQTSSYPDVRSLIMRNKLAEAETILDGVYMAHRDAEWYYLKGQIHQRRGWFDEAYKSYSKACELDPNNSEYRNAFNSLNYAATGGYKTSNNNSSDNCCGDCSACDICSSLICADCCCECMGGDLIKCI